MSTADDALREIEFARRLEEGRNADLRRLRAYENFHAYLKDQVEKSSLRKIAAMAGVNHTTLLKIINGADPRLSTVVKVVRSLGH